MENGEETLFEAALKLGDPRQRAAFLDAACQGQPDLRGRLEDLLAAQPEAEAFFRKRLNPESPTLLVPVTEKPGDRIGRYKLLQQIGEGGCGVVYMAEQEEPVRRRVALKVIKLGMDTKSVIARFEAERQALALMDHPNIAQVFDAGATETGRPYFVMELVRGIRVTDYCDQHNLSTRERLDLFIQVCHAIQHAHQKGIIHRDIKPSNILVTINDGAPAPKVIDFGIAKATNQQRLTDKTLFTAFEQFIGTPAYMSPEQAEMISLDIDTRSDIYALGVLLYELLTGKTPFDARELLAVGLEEMRRTIREQEPVRPSTKLNTLPGEELTTTAKRRGTEAPKLLHLVRGDLDWIVMRCLEKDRMRRYDTANGLAQDIERHLNHEPVTACPPSALYRAEKFIRRNKVTVTAGTAVAAALVLGTVVSTWQAVRARSQQVRAEANELLARQHAYAADVKLADTARRENNLGEALSALHRHIPKPGEIDLRGIEWRYLWHKCQGQQMRIFRHEAEVICAELSPDDRWLATASGGAFWVWDTAQWGESRALISGAPADVRDEPVPGEYLAFDPQGHFLATATRSEVVIWNTSDWRKLRSFPAINATICLSGDGSKLGIFGEEGFQLWQTGTWEPLKLDKPENIKHRSTGGRQFVQEFRCRIALSRDGSLLAWSWKDRWRGDEGAVTLFKLPECQSLSTWPEAKDVVRLAFSDNDHWLAAYNFGPPAMVWLWSLPEIKLVACWSASQDPGRALAFAPGGRLLATAGTDRLISLWETGNTNRQGVLQGHLYKICSVRFAADGRLVSASSDKTVRLWDTNRARFSPPKFTLPPERLFCGPTADVRTMWTVNLTNLTFEEWDVERDSGQPIRQNRIQGADAILNHGTLWNGLPLTKGLLTGGAAVCDNFNVKRGMAGLWNLAHPPGARAWDLCASTGDGRVYAWKADSGELVFSNKVASAALHAYLAGNQVIVYEYFWDALLSYDLQSGQTRVLEEHAPWGGALCKVSSNGRFLAYYRTNEQVRVWDTTTKQPRFTVQLPEQPPISVAIEFSPDSRLLAVATFAGWAQVFDVATGQPVSDPLAGFLTGTYKLNFSADGKSLVICGEDGTARLCNIATGREMLSGLPLSSLWEFEPTFLARDGNSVVESAGEGAIRVVRLPTLAEIDAVEKSQMRSP